jgi:hypothetical protein
MLYQVHLAGLVLKTLGEIDTKCIGRCKSNYHTITIMTDLISIVEFHKWRGVRDTTLSDKDSGFRMFGGFFTNVV